jgi:hypothetical protein
VAGGKLGLLIRQQANRVNIISMLLIMIVCVVLLLLIKWEILHLGWSWLIVIGTWVTFIISVTVRRIVAFIR